MSQRDGKSDRHLVAVPLISGGIMFAACAAIFVFHFRSVAKARIPASMLGGLFLGYAAVRLTVWMAARFYWIVGLAWVFASFVGAFLFFNVSPDIWVFREGVREWDAMRAWAWLACGVMLSAAIVGSNLLVSRWRGEDGGERTLEEIILGDDFRRSFFAEADSVTKSSHTGKRVHAMKIHARTAARGTILIAVSIFLVLSAMSAGAAEISPGTEGVGDLTTRERQEFIEGAKEFGGLNDEEVERVLEDPELVNTIPVDMETTSRTFNEPGVSSGLQARVAATSQCKRKVLTLQYVDASNQPLLKFVANKVWCFNGTIVTTSHMRNVQTWVRPDSQYRQETGGWRYDKNSEYGTEKYVAYAGYPRGSHLSTRAGRFEYAFPGETRASSVISPAVLQRGFRNGACHSVQYEAVQPIVHTGPPVQDNRSTATFTFSSKYQGSTFQCSLDGGAFANCNSPKTYTGLAEGTHSFQIQARNGAGYALPRPVTYRWMVETTAPEIVNVSPQDGATEVAANTNVEAKFSKEVEAFSLIGNVTLVKSASGVALQASLSYDPGTGIVTLNPNTDLDAGENYTATIRGGGNGVKDKAGNPLTEDKTWAFTIAK